MSPLCICFFLVGLTREAVLLKILTQLFPQPSVHIEAQKSQHFLFTLLPTLHRKAPEKTFLGREAFNPPIRKYHQYITQSAR